MFNHVSAVVLFVQDFEKCLAFYRDTLGLPVAQLEPKFAAFKMHDQDFALLHVSNAAEMVTAEIDGPPARGVNPLMLCARVQDVDAAYETLKAKGVEFTQGPTSQYWGLRTIYFKDPESNIWEFAQPLTPEQQARFSADNPPA
ncbi:MAG: VOC family protein [Burkholderiales bacterium]|nr:VOC family protein [Anaerolineae bacterium]